MKILIATEKPFAPAAVKNITSELEGAGHEVLLLEKYTDKAQLLEAVKDVDAMIVRSDKITPDVLDAANQLKIIVRAGAGYDSIDTKYAKEKNVVVENTPGQNSNAVAELVFGMLVYAIRNFYNGNMDVYAYDAFCPAEAIEAAGVHAVKTQNDLFKVSDVLSLHIPATPDTIKSINYEMVNQLPKKAILLNTARKEVINEEELLKLMAEREDLKFITDIKPDADEEFLKFTGRYFSTPKKMGAQTAEANLNAGVAAAKQINAFFETGDTTFQVNK